MDKFRDKLDGLSELSKDDLTGLAEEIATEFKLVSEQELSSDSVAAMDELVQASQSVKSALSNLEEQEAELTARREAAMAAMSEGTAEGEDGETAEASEGEEVEEAEAASENPFAKGDESEEEEEELTEEEKEDRRLNEATTSSEPVNTSHTKDDPAKLQAELNKENAKAEADKDTTNSDKAVKQTVAPESPEKLEADIQKENRKAASVETPVEAEASNAPITEDTQEKLLEEELPDVENTKVASVEDNDDTNPAEASGSQDNSENTNLEETLTASANDTNVPEEHQGSPRVDEAPSRTITAGADLPGITAGATLPNMRAVAQAILDRKKGMGRTTGGDGEQALVASFSTEFPENRMLSSHDESGNRRKIAEAVASRNEQPIVAAGGLLAPVDTSYDLYGLGTASRPVRDSLPVFNAERGGLRFLTPPVLSDLAGAVALWTLQDDVDAATEGAPDPVKPCLRVNAGEEVTVYIDAVTLCLTFGNIGARTFPELVERHTELAMIWHARFAETRLMTRIGALSTHVTAPAQLGLARDIFVQVEQAAAAYRGRHRMKNDDKLQAIFPEWFLNALRADLTKQAPGDGRETTFELADAKVNQWFAIRGIRVTWSVEGEDGQVFGPQTAPVAPATSAPLDGFPDTLVWYLFSEGTFLFLDGGTLDLGLVRDSTLNGTNDYQLFLETFEGVAKVGIESLRIESDVKIVGSASALTNINV